MTLRSSLLPPRLACEVAIRAELDGDRKRCLGVVGGAFIARKKGRFGGRHGTAVRAPWSWIGVEARCASGRNGACLSLRFGAFVGAALFPFVRELV
ncbi:MAG TPA: hypothetical protein VN804_00690, partial [Solirubrobacteraceae bacterium]|nr:hypothetical protein [Solirubrobacteraceae bacterium]